MSVVLLSYNRPEMFERALSSVLAQTLEPLEVIVVDNRSGASDAIRARCEDAGVRLLALSENLGYGAAINAALDLAGGEFVYITEDDISLSSNCIEALLAFIQTEESVDLACPLMIDAESGRVRSAGGRFRLGGVFRQEDYGAGESPSSVGTKREVAFIPGNMIFAKAAVVRGLRFRVDFFLYFEDLELCARAIRSGRGLAMTPSAMVFNLDPPGAVAISATQEFHKIKNHFSLYLLHARGSILPVFFLRYGLLAWLRSPWSLTGRARLKAAAWVTMNLFRLMSARLRQEGLSTAELSRRLERFW